MKYRKADFCFKKGRQNLKSIVDKLTNLLTTYPTAIVSCEDGLSSSFSEDLVQIYLPVSKEEEVKQAADLMKIKSDVVLMELEGKALQTKLDKAAHDIVKLSRAFVEM